MIRAGLLSSASLAAILLAAAAISTSAQDASPQPRMDMRKAIIEAPIKKLISGDAKTSDFARLDAVTPQKRDMSGNSRSVSAAPSEAVPAFHNPKVKPGLVNWRPDFVSACEESRRSGKPVLLFHMMGKLDDGFC